MTDIRIGGLVRETLDATGGELRVGGLVREVLNTGGLATRIALAGMAREALLAAADSVDSAASGAGAARFMMRRRTMQMINDNPRLARKLGIRGKLQILE